MGQTSQSTTTTVTATEQGAIATIVPGQPRAPYHPSRVIVRFRDSARNFLPGSGSARALGSGELFLVWNPPGLTVSEAVRSYKANPNVLDVEPDFEVKTSDIVPNDARWGEQWDMIKIAAPAAWVEQTDASDVVVAIVDTGIDFTHPDLRANLWSDPADPLTHGFTCINGSCVPGGQDDYGHGTHVAGTIGAVANNSLGIAGINWYAKMISFKFLDSNGSGYTSDAINAYNKILKLKTESGVNLRVTNNSWGGGEYSLELKKAMEAVESVGIVNVCAAGNSGQNADAIPMYPAAYDNRGIVSVLATDINDAGAGFSNYGLASVDLAAPGVNTLSTVPSVTCALCYPSGYRALSGTSMATPHVAGVLAALIHKNPLLSAYEARDVILDPGSYDSMIETKARTSSTGGRLNFFKAYVNPRRSNPGPLNNFPLLTMGPDVFAAGGAHIDLVATANDADSDDALRIAWARSTGAGSAWLFGWMANSLFPNPSGNGASFVAPTVARAVTMAYDASVADGRGGSASGKQFATVSATPGQQGPPAGSMSVSATSAPAGSTITVNYQPVDQEGLGQPAWDLWVTGNGGANGACCYTQSSTGVTFYSAGVYRISVQAVDRALDLSPKQSVVVTIGNAAGSPPIARTTLDRNEGPVPLTVYIDMSSSEDEDGSIQSYSVDCGGGTLSGGTPAWTATCTYDKPGIYWQLMQVRDNSGLLDVISNYVVATPAGGNGSVPAPPEGLTASRLPGSVSLSWLRQEDAAQYQVKRATTSGGPYAWLKTVISDTHYMDPVPSDCVAYYYVVSAVNSSGESANSAEAQVIPLTTPPAPTGFSANAGTGKVTLNWTADFCATSYGVDRRKFADTQFTSVATGIRTASFVDTHLIDGTEYFYVVSASNDLGRGPNSIERPATPIAAPTMLPPTAGDRQISLQWTTVTGATGYKVKRATSRTGTYAQIAVVTAPQTSCPDTGVINGTTYYYVVSGTNDSGESQDSNQVAATPQAGPVLQSLTLPSSKIKVGTTMTGTVTLSGPALTDIFVDLSSSNTNALTVPPNSKVSKGINYASFTITAKGVTSNKNVKVTATYNGVSKQQTVMVTK